MRTAVIKAYEKGGLAYENIIFWIDFLSQTPMAAAMENFFLNMEIAL